MQSNWPFGIECANRRRGLACKVDNAVGQQKRCYPFIISAAFSIKIRVRYCIYTEQNKSTSRRAATQSGVNVKQKNI
jgi:hypothetical protein